ncbi:unnamed protein product [Moneuplotes crassus]|uniref:Uncharacterized protein n=1 Tax=Euplotes crassus TaxID=5936 RepID=A0AAD1X3X6_EUPCR|nr:unnamed protein product [Moneuplotes crassus]
MSNSSDRLQAKNYIKRPNSKTLKDPMKYEERPHNINSQLQNSRHVKSKSSIMTKYKENNNKLYELTRPSKPSFNPVTSPSNIAYPKEFICEDIISTERTPHYTLKTKKKSMMKNMKFLNNLKSQSSLIKKNGKILKKYSNPNGQSADSQAMLRHSCKSSCHQTKNLKIKKGQSYKTINKEIGKSHYSSESMSSLKKGNFSLNNKIKKKGRQVSSNKQQNERNTDISHPKNHSKSIGSQLMNYTKKSKRLTTSTETTSKANIHANLINNSTSCNLLNFCDQNSSSYGKRKMTKYVQAKNTVKGKNNKTEEYCNPRRSNTSFSHQSNSNCGTSSKSKVKKKKKKPAHMKSHSNIPMYYEGHISTKGSAKKQYSGSKSKKKKTCRHGHHQSQSNAPISFKNKNNMIMIDGSMGVREISNL